MSKLPTHRGVVHMCLQAVDNVAFEDTHIQLISGHIQFQKGTQFLLFPDGSLSICINGVTAHYFIDR